MENLTDEMIQDFSNTLLVPLLGKEGCIIGAKFARDWMQEHKAQAPDVREIIEDFYDWLNISNYDYASEEAIKEYANQFKSKK